MASVALGTANESTGNTSVAIGRQSYALSDFSIATGNIATVEAGADNGIAIGTNSRTAVPGGVAIGLDAVVTGENSVALGPGSVAVEQTGSSYLTGVPATTDGTVSVGSDTIKRRITNLADGSAASDAVTVAQLQSSVSAGSAANTTRSEGNMTALGGSYDAVTDTYTPPEYVLDNSTTTVKTVGEALGNLDSRTTNNTTAIASGLNFAGDTGDNVNRPLGSILNITGGANPANLTTGNIGVVVNGTDGLSIQLAEAIDLGADGSVTTGNTVTNSDGVAITDGTVGGASTTITATGTNVIDDAGNEADYTAAGSSLSDGLGNTTNTTAAGTTVEDTAGNISNYGAEGFTTTDDAGNNGISINQGGISFIDAGGAPTGPSITATGIDADDTVITNLADGVNTDDAVTKGQVDAVSDGLTDLTAGAVQYDRDPSDNSIINYDRVTLAGTPAVIEQDDEGNDYVASGGTTLSNVAEGVNADDAVNKGQLDTLIAQNVTNVEVTDQNGNPVTVNVTDQVVNRNIDDSNMDSQFLTYDVNGQEVTDRLTIGETVQKMNTEGVKFAHTNAVSTEGDIGVTNDSSAGGDNSTAIGVNAIITQDGESSVALGHNTLVEGASSIAIGDGAQALGNQSISIGTGNIVNGDNSGAFGDPSTINGNNSYSVGNNNTIDSDDTFVLGNGITANQNGSVVLGLGSAATTGAGIVGYRAAGNAAITATTSTTGAVAVGDAANGVYRQVTGVAAGTADSDAVNVSQLKSVSDALESSNEALSNAAVQYDTNPDDTVNKGSITLGGGAAGTTITNVNGGAINAGSADAINGGQLYNLGNDVAGIIGGDAAIDDEGNLTATNIGGTGANNLNDAIAAVNNGNAQANEDIQANTDRLDTGLSFSADSGTNVDKSIGDSTAVKFEGSDNITTTTTDSGIKFDLSGNISVDNVTADTITTGNTTVNTNGVTIANGPSMTTEGINAGGKTITGVADGLNPTDAVNFGQLSALDGKLSNSVNELGYKINEVEDDANAGISAAMAMSSLPQAYIPGKSMIGGGVATYNGESAVAIGLSKVSDNGRWVMKINGTADTQGNAGGAIGAGFHF
ncbi:YadA-like family protein [Psychrobacter aquimaris]